LDWVATVPPTVRLTEENFGKHSGVLFGWIWASHQLGAATAAFGGGFIYTLVGNYTPFFIAGGFVSILAASLVLRIRKLENGDIQ
jgi:predicted MFS family arabinose efflux permease